ARHEQHVKQHRDDYQRYRQLFQLLLLGRSPARLTCLYIVPHFVRRRYPAEYRILFFCGHYFLKMI
ncbi:MAG: hypothetical protein IKS78_04675, partial [Clostridia bacterium]|nr:hypothetical protein [Clostridia bacterium]